MKRRHFLASSASTVAASSLLSANQESASKPNILYLFSDQWRAMDHGYMGNSDVRTPHIDQLADQSVNFSNAVSGIPVCCPHRACLMTGQYPLTHGLYLNDLRLNTNAPSFAQALSTAGYDTGYVGKWHLDGTGRSAHIPPERRQGFDYWKVLECTHNYNKSLYYDQTAKKPLQWEGYDAYAQTKDAIRYLKSRPAAPTEGEAPGHKPFALFLSWGPPHAPYRTGPTKWLDRYDSRKLTLRQNVPVRLSKEAQSIYAGYYAHCSALDECVGWIMDALKEAGHLDNTIIVYTSDHGDMLHSRGQLKKQRPWDESIRVPFLVRCPDSMKVKPQKVAGPINTPDIMPTVLSLAGAKVPDTVEGEDFSEVIRGKRKLEDNHALITCPSPFGQWTRKHHGGREYRGVRTNRYTYTRSLEGPWELFDNQEDPFQQRNLVEENDQKPLRDELEDKLQARLKGTGDDFAPSAELIKRSDYRVDANGTVGYRDPASWGQVSKPARVG